MGRVCGEAGEWRVRPGEPGAGGQEMLLPSSTKLGLGTTLPVPRSLVTSASPAPPASHPRSPLSPSPARQGPHCPLPADLQLEMGFLLFCWLMHVCVFA